MDSSRQDESERASNTSVSADGKLEATTEGDDDQTPTSAWSTRSDHQLGRETPPSASDLAGDDRVFPISSVVRVDPIPDEDLFPHLAETDNQGPGIAVHLLSSTTRTDSWTDARRSEFEPMSPTSPPPSHDRAAQIRMKRAISGPYSSLQADAVRHSSSTPLNLDIAISDRDGDESAQPDDDEDSEDEEDSLIPADASIDSDGLSASDAPHIATRFTHVMTSEGHAVITGRDGVLQRCEEEPIHIPGAIQSFGVLLAMREEDEGQFVVRYVSENCRSLLGYTPQQLFRVKSFLDILTEEQQDNLLDHIDFIRDEDTDPAANGPEVFSISIRIRKEKKSTKLWCAMHINPAHPDLIICEFERDDDKDFPLRPPEEKSDPPPTDTLSGNPTLEQIEESTEVLSKPLRVLRSARKKRGDQGAMQVFDIMSQVQEQLSSAPNLDIFLKVLIGIVKELTGFHRVMIYQFDASWNGKVVAELVDASKTTDLYKGLHFPASDIPAQARDLYKLNKVRLLYDRDLESSRIVCRTKEDLAVPLDMSHAYLRAMSPIHLKYLANMANPTGYIIASSDDLLRLFDADFGLLSIRGETKILGAIEQSQEALVVLEYLRMRRLTSIVASQDIREDFPDLQYPLGFQVIAGLLYVPLSIGGHDFIVFLRKGQIKEVRWAGNPYEKTLREGTEGYLEPRSSFKTWNELVIGKCREWVEEQIETAAVLCLVYGKFIEVWREKEAALQNTRLTRLLLANSAHEVRTPLNAIINYLEIALEGSLDQETRDNLAKSHSASKALIYVINDLLDLTKTEEGHILAVQETFDLAVCVNEAAYPFRIDAERKGIEYQVTQHPGLPRFVKGDSRRVRQVITNITANAIAHTSAGHVNVDVFVAEVREDQQVIIEIVVEDSGSGMSPAQTDALFRDLEQVSTEETEFRLPNEEGEKTQEMKTLGLGLAVVARIINNAGGQLRLKSKEGEGSRFAIQLPFQLPEESPGEDGDGPTNNAVSSNPEISATKPLPVVQEGEILLVNRSKNTGDSASIGRQSIESRRSGTSQDGSQKSDADRLIDAIKTPLALMNDKDPEYFSSKAHSSNPPKLTSTSFPAPMGEPLGHKPPANPPDEGLGGAKIRDSKVPVRAIKVPDEYIDMPPLSKNNKKAGSVSETDTDATETKRPTNMIGTATADNALCVLVAEDDPINMKILKKRLERAGNMIHHAVNGEDCAAIYSETSSMFDVVLMDMQMPIVDGLTSTKLIRATEASSEHRGHSSLASRCGRIPIFAVSASLVEELRDTYIEAGFDGWILKPIDFKRLATLLKGIYDDETRKSCIYVPGEWERGGWFTEPSKGIVPTEAKA
ncbi:atpase-like, atp-binding domain [Trichoderma arundinaceum]|uniref:Atpase-like, atp-binding domain n=1 Tax=Trichoderma arundinaceum TaxID=490622 RepID=A0A395NLE7_TRIAR|nr:atpase-like, atp-binding domain [Trichoderma arundinaceum]